MSTLPDWIPDDSVTHCMGCTAQFTFSLRKHHCRRCGRIVCQSCSSSRAVLPQATEAGPVRVCDQCMAQMAQQGEAAVQAVEAVAPSPSRPTARSITAEAVPVATALPVASLASQPSSSPVPVASPAGPPQQAKPVPVAAVAPKMVIPTAAAVSVPAAAPASTSSGGFFAGFATKISSKLDKHAPGLVAAVKEHVAAAATKHEEARIEKKQHAERIIAQADASSAPVVTPAAAVPQSSPAAASASTVHIPGLGAVALAASPAVQEGKQKDDGAAWSSLAKLPEPSEQGQGGVDARASAQMLSQPSTAAQLAAGPLYPAVAVENELRRRTGGKGEESTGKRGSLSETSVSTQSNAQSQQSFKMDLPLRLCLVILKKTSQEMREKYTEYLSTKQRRQEGDEPLSFPQFMFFSTIRTLPEFLFKKTELAYCMMREEGDTLVFSENFRRYAPILSPLASKLDADKLYTALEQASIASGAALTQEQVDQENEEEWEQRREQQLEEQEGGEEGEISSTTGETSASNTTQPPLTKRKAGGIAFVQFKIYVESLRKHCTPDSFWPDFKSFGADYGMDKHEQLLVVRTGVTDTTHFPPRIGKLGLTTNFLLYQPNFLKGKRGIRWTSVQRVEANEEGFWKSVTGSASNASSSPATSTSSTSSSSSADTPTKGFKLYILDENESASLESTPRKETCITLDIPGWGQDAVLERQRTFEYIRIMIHLHRLVASIPDKVVSSALIQETCATLLRMKSLESVGLGCNPLLLNPFPGYVLDIAPPSSSRAKGKKSAAVIDESTDGSDSTSFVSSISASISRSDAIRKSKSSWLFAVLPGLQNKEQESLAEDIDPEVASQNYKTAEELLKLQQAHEQPFTLKNFAYNVKLFRYEIEPFMLFLALLKRVRDWENPIVTLLTVMILLNMAWKDLLMYLPALLILINIVLLSVLRYYPNAVWIALGGPQSEYALPGDRLLTATGTMPVGGGATIEEITESKEDLEALGGPQITDGGTLTGISASSSSSHPALSPGQGGVAGKSSIPTAHPVAQPVAGSPAASAAAVVPPVKKEESEGLFAKLKNYRDVAVKTKDYLHSVQNTVAEQNVKMMKVEGLYKWRSPLVTQKFFAMLCAGFVVMVFIPFRFIFPFLVIDWFTTKWQKSGSLERLLDEVTLPARMPDID